MPPLQPVPDVLKAQLQWSDSADLDVYNNLFFRFSGGSPSVADAVAIATSLFTAATNFQPVCQTSVALTGVTVTDLSSSSAAQGTHNAVATGELSAGPLAGGTALVIGYAIARRYRGGKPRNYFPFGATTSLNTRQQWSTEFVTQCQNVWNSFITAAIGTVGGSTTISAHVNVSYYEGSKVVISPTTGRARNVPIPRAVPQVDTIGGFTVRTIPGSQRRRNRV